MGYLPDIYQEFKQQYPEVSKAYDALAISCHQWGPLDAKTRRLIKLGIATSIVDKVFEPLAEIYKTEHKDVPQRTGLRTGYLQGSDSASWKQNLV